MTDFAELRELAQRNLVSFLRTELDLGFTFVHTAELEADIGNREHFERARENAKAALGSIHHFSAKIIDAETQRQILERARELETLVASLSR